MGKEIKDIKPLVASRFEKEEERRSQEFSEALTKQTLQDSDSPSTLVKPPLGLIPRSIHEEIVKRNRVNDIMNAMHNYAKANKLIPEEWVGELMELYKELFGAWTE